MTNYESSEFLVDGSVAFDYDNLPYGEKLKIKALQGLDSLAASLNAISNVKAIEFQINISWIQLNHLLRKWKRKLLTSMRSWLL